MNKILVSITTPVLNGAKTIESTIKSILGQNYGNIEYIVVDSGSTDGTLEIVDKYKDKIAKVLSESKRGIYPAMDAGLKSAKGEIIGNLNSDDFYADENVIKTVVETMEKEKADVCWGDLVYVDRVNTNKIIRFWKSTEYKKGKFQKGWMPPHPTFFVRKWVYEKYGYLNLDFSIAADYELMLRFLERYRVRSCYIPKIMIKMRKGGESNKSLINIIKANWESYRAWQINGLKINPLRILLKPLSKITQYFKRK
jgi:glycosyltransferase